MSGARDDSDGNVAAIARREWLLRLARRVAALLILAAITAAGLRGYTRWHERSLAKEAGTLCDQHNYAAAALVAQRALVINPANAKACRVLAEATDAAGNAETVSWRLKVAVLRSARLDDQFALADAALRFKQTDLAGKVLAAIPLTARDCAQFHALSGTLALAEKQLFLAEGYFTVALRREPTNPQYALNLAVVRLASSDPSKRNPVRTTLAELSRNPVVRSSALRVLASDALTRRDLAAAAKWSAELCAQPGATQADALVHLEAIHGSLAATIELAELQRTAAPSPVAVAELMTWMNDHELAGEVLKWLPLLPENVASVHPVPLAVAEAWSARRDWPGLRNWVSEKNWGDFECLRLAVESHAVRELREGNGFTMDADALWHSALKLATGHPRRTTTMARLADGWGYLAESEEAWWTIANGQKDPKAALLALNEHYKLHQNSYGLLHVAQRALELNPEDELAANNVASLGLLLNGSSASSRLAGKLYAQNPQNPACVATYAFALHVQNKTADGLRVLYSLKDEQLHSPAIAAYYLVLLVGDGQMERAQPFLPLAQKASLLPEEQKLVAEAARKIVQWEAKAAQNLAHS